MSGRLVHSGGARTTHKTGGKGKWRGAVLVGIVVGLLAGPAAGSGGTVHMFVTDTALSNHLQSPELRTLLQARRSELLAGSWYPDGGYQADNGSPSEAGKIGEPSHWDGFVEAYLQHLRAIGAASNPAMQNLVAHLMGAASHCLEDQMVDHAFFHLSEETDGHGQDLGDTGVDVFALLDHGRFNDAPPSWFTPTAELLKVYQGMGFDIAGLDKRLNKLNWLLPLAIRAELALTVKMPTYQSSIPWIRSHYFDSPLGISARAVLMGRYLEALWRRLQGIQDNNFFLGSFPADGTQAQSGESRSAGSRIFAVFSRGVDRGSLNGQSFFLTDAQGRTIPTSSGASSSGNDAQLLWIQPQIDLEPGQGYTVHIQGSVRDRHGVPMGEAVTFSFLAPRRDAAGALELDRAILAATVGPEQAGVRLFGHHWNVSPAGVEWKASANGAELVVTGELTRTRRLQKDNPTHYRARFREGARIELLSTATGDEDWQKAARRLAEILVEEIGDALPAWAAIPPAPGCEAVLYQDVDFGGQAIRLGPGMHSLFSLERDHGLANDALSSLRLPAGYQAIGFEHADFTGQRWVFQGEVPWVGDGANDRVSAIWILPLGAGGVR